MRSSAEEGPRHSRPVGALARLYAPERGLADDVDDVGFFLQDVRRSRRLEDVGRERAPRDRAHHRVRQVTMIETVGEWKENTG